MPYPFDVIIVPDFGGSQTGKFEARTLLFLASWLESAGCARNFPLHVACIGEPPPSVHHMASLCDVSLTVHEPMRLERGGFANKLRGFEVHGQTNRVLLLDVDIVVLSDLSALSDLGTCLAATPANAPRVPEGYWDRIYPELGMDVPKERMAWLSHELRYRSVEGLQAQKDAHEYHPMMPYYNSGVLFAPWDCALSYLWADHISRIATLFHEGDDAWASVGQSDQAGLATAIEWLKRTGVPFKRLPDEFHTHWRHIYYRVMPLNRMRLFHGFYLFENLCLISTGSILAAINCYQISMMRKLGRKWRRDLLAQPRFRRTLDVIPMMLDIQKLCNTFRNLHHKYVYKVL